MNRLELLGLLTLPIQKSKIQELAALAGEEKLPVQELLYFCFLKDKPAIAFRAAWVLECMAAKYPKLFSPCLQEFIQRLHEQQNSSCQRHFTKILMLFTSPSAKPLYHNKINTTAEREQVVEVVFEWLINPATPVAVRVNCLDILLNLSKEFSWIKEELEAQTIYYLDGGSPAMQSRGRRILQHLRK